MKAIGRNLLIKKVKEGTTKTKGGLLLAENQREDIRYVEASVVSVGSEVNGVNEGDKILDMTCHNNYVGDGCKILNRNCIGVDLELKI